MINIITVCRSCREKLIDLTCWHKVVLLILLLSCLVNLLCRDITWCASIWIRVIYESLLRLGTCKWCHLLLGCLLLLLLWSHSRKWSFLLRLNARSSIRGIACRELEVKDCFLASSRSSITILLLSWCGYMIIDIEWVIRKHVYDRVFLKVEDFLDNTKFS